MFVNSQQLLIIILFLCEVITLNKINMNFFVSFILFFFFYSLKIMEKNQALDSTLIFIIYNSRTRLHRGIIKQNSKLDHAINFILLDQDTTNRIELRKTIKIGVVMDTVPGHLPQAWQLPRGVPIPDTQFFFVGEEGVGDDG